MKRFRAGPLFHRLIHNFNLTLQGSNGEEKGRLIYLLSGHDHTIISFLNTLHLYSNDTRPSFASAVIIELHRLSADNDNLLEIKVNLIRAHRSFLSKT